ncbi:Putative transposase [Heterostelium album PN500]|uniref:Transposase n=1 Tax=Heterostelium pallidum (strain ATCC 26659 / Pp 5 / PN500) TaxID=670386 RepID=D3AWS1_HETP5|nr:Putative transposase [Heterostelium album PN500]EFA86744.1 Putative transposase [Heterostelium album PN500]|eukprot:XP_020438848.1 Putative transposase [Heterostelium album PN500]
MNNFVSICKICSSSIENGQDRYVCTECHNLVICSDCYPKSHQIEDLHTDSAPIPHHCTLETKSNYDHFISNKVSEDSSQSLYNAFNSFSHRPCIGCSKVGVYLPNIPEWYYADLGCLWFGMTIVPFHFQINKENLNFILENSGTSAIVVNSESFKNIANILESNHQFQLKLIIHVEDQYDVEIKNKLPSNVEFKLFSEMESTKETFLEPIKNHNRDILSINYTSGTTSGVPKGVINKNNDFMEYLGELYLPYPMVKVSFASLAHIQRKIDYRVFFTGGRIGLYSGDKNKIFDFISLLRPHNIPAAPRVWNILYSNYVTSLQTYIEDHLDLSFEECTSNVMQKFKSHLGDRIKNITNVGAPLSSSVFNFMKTCWGEDKIYNFYGSTEVSAISINNKILPMIQYRVESIPSLGFTTDDKPYPRGQLVVTSTRMSAGYYNNEEDTKKSFKDGWYYTGDIVEEIAPNTIRVLDRMNNSFKLSNGEFVCAEKLETLYSNSKYIQNIFVYGDSMKSFLVGVVIPTQEALKKVGNISIKDANKSNPLKKLIYQDIEKISQMNMGLIYEIPKIISIDSTEWSIDNNLINPNGKYNRNNLFNFYEASISSMYQILESIQSKINTCNKKKVIVNYLQTILGYDINDIDNLDLSSISFTDIGGDSVGAARLSNLLKENFNVNLSTQSILDRNNTLGNLLLEKPEVTPVKVNWEEEMNLDESIQVNGKPIIKDGFKNVFLTGATGYNGSFVLYNLLKTPSCSKVYCLTRSSKSVSIARAKLVDILRFKNMLSLKEEEIEKIHPVIGNLDSPLFGLDIDTFTNLSNELDIIIHNGASTQLMNPYLNLKMANVKGTEEILRLSAVGNRVIPVFHISTIGVYHDLVMKEGVEPDLQRLDQMSGYPQSKLVAEQLVQTAFKRGLPVSICRLGHIYSHSESGVDNENDFLRLLLRGILTLGYYPDFSKQRANQLTLSPVDWVSTSIVHLATKRNWSAIEEKTPTYLLTNFQSISFNDFFKSISNYHPLEMVSYSKWIELLFANPNNPLNPIIKSLTSQQNETISSVDLQNISHLTDQSRFKNVAHLSHLTDNNVTNHTHPTDQLQLSNFSHLTDHISNLSHLTHLTDESRVSKLAHLTDSTTISNLSHLTHLTDESRVSKLAHLTDPTTISNLSHLTHLTDESRVSKLAHLTDESRMSKLAHLTDPTTISNLSHLTHLTDESRLTNLVHLTDPTNIIRNLTDKAMINFAHLNNLTDHQLVNLAHLSHLTDRDNLGNLHLAHLTDVVQINSFIGLTDIYKNPKTIQTLIQCGGLVCPSISDQIIHRHILHIKSFESIIV